MENKENIQRDEQIKRKRWIRCMEIGARTGCHQMPERSFFFHGYQFPVCARCCGVFLGYVAGLVAAMKIQFCKLKNLAIFGLLAMFFDWFLQAVHIKESTNTRRLITGIAGGFGSMVVFVRLVMLVTGKVKSIVNR